MKPTLLLFSAFFAASAQAQTSPGTQAAQQGAQQAAQAAQQAAQQAQQANEKAIADMRHASDQAALDHQRAIANANQASQNALTIPFTLPPKISIKSGTYTHPITVKLSDRTRGAIMYYTTDGWTPTTQSTRYMGPLNIDSTTTLNVIAFSPEGGRSLVTSAVYTFPGSSVTDQTAASVPNGTIPVRLLFARDVTSKTAEIGDRIPLTLAEDLVVNGAVVVRKGAPASVTMIQVDKTGAGGAPGNLEFQIDPLQTTIGLLKLRGSATLEGQAATPNATALIPVVDIFILFRHGHHAIIRSGAPFTAYLDTTSLVASKTE